MAYSKYNIIYQLQKWMDSVAGQTFLNYAYSWGASIVILGTLFKLTRLPGANFFLFLGMGTEVLVFFIAAFDRPFDKTTDGMVLQGKTRQAEREEPEPEYPPYVGDDDRTDYSRRVYRMGEQLLNAEQLIRQLPDNGESEGLNKTLTALHEMYKLQLEKSSTQVYTISDIGYQLETLSEQLKEMNRVYGRMLEAINSH